MTVIVYKWNGSRYEELFRVMGNKVSNYEGVMFLEDRGIPINEDEVFKKLRSNMVYLVVREDD